MDKKFMVYSKIKELKAAGFSQRNIAKQLGISRSTVANYSKLNYQEFSIWFASTQQRTQKLDIHKERLLEWLRKYPDLSTSQIHDWLEERGFSGIAESTLRQYVKILREDYNLPKTSQKREYEAIPDPPIGEHIQIDFGQLWVPTKEDKRQKLYVVAFVLSHSRYKYMEWWDHPYTAHDVIAAHERAFQFFGGKPKTIVYDQDRTLFVDENYGDIIFTSAFESYRQIQPFKIHACRGFDPESKGRVENVIGFVKNNFAKNRTFTDLTSWNEQALAWLRRKGNGKIHNTTKLIPAEQFQKEQVYLLPVVQRTTTPGIKKVKESTLRQLTKDNTIKYKTNRYSVPRDTYNRLSEVSVFITNDNLRIVDPDTGEILATHVVCLGNGKLIKSRKHGRDQTRTIKALIEKVANHFSNIDLAKAYINDIHSLYPRYTRDQTELLDSLFSLYSEEILNQALVQCSSKKIITATGFRDVAKRLAKETGLKGLAPKIKADSLPPMSQKTKGKLENIEPEVRDLTLYTSILKGAVH